jgi:site-specific recombinase XerD
MRDSANLPALLQSFFTTRLMTQRKASPHTIASYRDTFRLLLQFAQARLRKAPSQLELNDLDGPLIGAFLEDLEKRRRNGARSRNLRLTAMRDTAEKSFRRLRTAVGISRSGPPRCQPRLHDLRHTFAVHRLLAWYEAGEDVQRLLPQLATYLGHRDLVSTQRYLTMTPEVLREAGKRFASYALGGDHE